jgi:hypothetical protein
VLGCPSGWRICISPSAAVDQVCRIIRPAWFTYIRRRLAAEVNSLGRGTRAAEYAHGVSELGHINLEQKYAHGVCFASSYPGTRTYNEQHHIGAIRDRVPCLQPHQLSCRAPAGLLCVGRPPACSKAAVASTGPEMVAADRPTSSPPRDVTWRRASLRAGTNGVCGGLALHSPAGRIPKP